MRQAGNLLVGLSEMLVHIGGRAAAALLLAVTLLIDLEILLRIFADRSLHVTEEFSGYAMAGIVFLGAGHTLMKGEHIRVQILYDRLSRNGQRWLDAFALVVSLVLASLLLSSFFDFFMSSVRFGTRSFSVSRTPMVIPHGIVVIGLALLWVAFLLLLVRVRHRRTDED